VDNLAIVETILRNRHQFFIDVREGVELNEKMRAMIISSVACFALYGAVMGSTHSLWQMFSSAAKLPALFLVTLVVCSPTLYFFNLIFGSNQSLMQNFSLILTAITVTSVLLLSFAPILLFFVLTTNHYRFFKLLNVGIFAVSGTVGMVFLSQGMRIVSDGVKEGFGARKTVVRLWTLLYAFVGSQMAWTLRPFIGDPDYDFELFRQLGGNFYSDVLSSIGEILGLITVR